MTAVFYDFSGETIGSLPAYMTLYSQTGDWTLTIQDESSVRGLRVNKTSSGSDPFDGVFTTVGSMDNSQDVEIVAQCKFRAGADTTITGPTFLTLFMNYATDLAAYSLTYQGNTSTPRFEIVRRSTTFTSSSIRGTYNMPGAVAPTVDQIFRIRFRHQTNGVMRARMCFAANCTDADELTEINVLLVAALQPTVASIDEAKNTSQAWHINGTADTTYTAGYFTVHGGTSGSYPFFGPYMGIATAGETAPTSAGGGTVNTETLESTITVTDEPLDYVFYNRLLESNLVLFDELVTILVGTISRTLSDTLTVDDGAVLFYRRNRLLDDTIVITEGTLEQYITTNIVADETLDVVDGLIRYAQFNRLGTDSLVITDSLIAALVNYVVQTAVLSSDIVVTDAEQHFVYVTRLVESTLSLFDEQLPACLRFILLTDAFSVDDGAIATYVPDPGTPGQVFNPVIRIGFDQPRIDTGGYAVH